MRKLIHKYPKRYKDFKKKQSKRYKKDLIYTS